jgi:hypothetical protein
LARRSKALERRSMSSNPKTKFESDLWHRTAFGQLPQGAFSGFTHGGNVVRVGKGAVVLIRYEWDDDHGNKSREAPVRAYELTRPIEAAGTGRYDTLLCFSWTLDYAAIIRLPGHEVFVPSAVLVAMQNNPRIVVDTDWYVSDGFECVTDVVSKFRRVVVGSNATPLDPLAWGCPGRVTIELNAANKPTEITKYDSWPVDLCLAEWHGDQDYMDAVAQRQGFAYPQPLGADEIGPAVSEPLCGGPEHPAGSGRTLIKEATSDYVRGYSFRRPDSDTIEYIRLSGDLHADPLQEPYP